MHPQRFIVAILIVVKFTLIFEVNQVQYVYVCKLLSRLSFTLFNEITEMRLDDYSVELI